MRLDAVDVGLRAAVVPAAREPGADTTPKHVGPRTLLDSTDCEFAVPQTVARQQIGAGVHRKPRSLFGQVLTPDDVATRPITKVTSPSESMRDARARVRARARPVRGRVRARSRWPSLCGSSSSPNQTATSPPTTTGRPPVSTTTTCMPRVWPGAGRSRSPGSSSSSPSTGTYAHAGRVDPLANGVVVLAAGVVELPTLDVDRPTGEEVVAAAVVEVQVRVDDDVDAGEVEVLRVQWT